MSSSYKHSKISGNRSSGSSRGSRESGRGSAADESQDYPDPSCDMCGGTGSYVGDVMRNSVR